MNLFDLSGKTAIVTGGSLGIGFGIARGLASAGAGIVIASRRDNLARAAAESLHKDGLSAVAVPTDVSRTDSIDALVKQVVADFGRIDILVNNAGFVIRKPAEEFTEEEWDRLMATNLRGLFFCAQRVGKQMIAQKKGKIINISSVVSQIAQSNRAVYAVSKAGISHLTRALALEWAPHNINVNAIGPGVTITDINKEHFAAHPEELRKFVDNIPLGREAYPDDYAGAAVFLASDASNYVTGQVLIVDGGMVLP